MNNYQKQQYQVFEKLEQEAATGETKATLVETRRDYASDKRICLTSIVFATPKIQQVIMDKIIEPLRQTDDRQYFFPPESLHITIQNVRTAGGSFTPEDVKKAKKVFQNIVPKYKSFVFELRGLLSLPTSLAIRAYSDKTLADLVFGLRKELAKAGVPDDKQYASTNILFGNMTVCRYTTEPNENFRAKVAESKTVDLGKLEVGEIDLITTSAVCHPDKTKILATYNLK
ncbi:MAG: hypothetical protein HQ530_02880 [Parcubacteria group bacterium]|nr:hypothetical protein [Parcubacteria group bacterium]